MSGKTTHLVSLKFLTRQYLNSNLIKLQQCSSWGSRPLSDKQILYAATDALVLLRLYDAMLYEIEDIFAEDCMLLIGSCKCDIDISKFEEENKIVKRMKNIFTNFESDSPSSSKKRKLSPTTTRNISPELDYDRVVKILHVNDVSE